MAAVSQKIPNLLGGVSQQPDPVKLPGQVRAARNVYLDPTFGCRKRPPTEFIAQLATNVPEDAKWFPIFRDKQERYAVAMYQSVDGDMVLRAWDMNNGTERTVNISDISKDYFAGVVTSNNDGGLEKLSHLTVADYTLIANSDRAVTMAAGADISQDNETALVIIKTVAYNSNYAIDLDGSGGVEASEVTRATKVTVSPGSWIGGGGCGAAGAQDYTINDAENGKTGLSFRIVVNCGNKQVTGKEGEIWYDSQYTVSVTLKNGGQGWVVGDRVDVTLANIVYSVTVTETDTTTTYSSDGSASYATPANTEGGVLDIGVITGGLVDALNTVENYSAESVGNCIRITKTNGESFSIAVRGGVADSSMDAIKGLAQDVSLLPDQCFKGEIVKVANTAESDADDYYVKFVTSSDASQGPGHWVETHKPGIPTDFNSSTMPQALIREADGSFTLKPLDAEVALNGWASREVGDEETNPEPSFTGRGISSMFFYSNRMGFLSEDSVVMSQPGDYFNFFSVSALTVSDADPIDITASATEPAILKAAVGAPKGLVLFAERSQFLLSTSEVAFAASTVKLNEISKYFYRSDVSPLSTGISIAFISEASTYSKVLEMAVDSVENRPEVADITRIIPTYLPRDLSWGEVMPNNNMLLYGDGSNNVYVFKFFNQGNERQIAGWATWTLPSNVLMLASEDDLSYLVTYDGTRHNLVKMELIDDPDTAPLVVDFSSFTPRLDNYIPKADLTVADNDTLTDKVYIPPAILVPDAQYVLIATDGDFASTFIRPAVESDDDGSYIVADKGLTTSNFILGIEYSADIELPSIFMTQEGRADRVNIPIVENLYLDLYYSGSYEVSVEKIGYPTQQITLETTTANVYDANEVPILEISTLAVPIFSRGDMVKTTISAKDPYPSSITGYSWEGHYNNRGIRRIQ